MKNGSTEILPSKSKIIADQIESEIRSGILAPGAKIQSVRELAATYRVSATTANYACKNLEKKNLIVRKMGSGTIVNPDISRSKSKLVALITSFRQENIENYYEALFSASVQRRVVPIAGLLDRKMNWWQSIQDIIAKEPDCILVDVGDGVFALDDLQELFGSTSVCYCHRWDYDDVTPNRAVLIDFAGMYADAIKTFRGLGHEKILMLTHNPVQFDPRRKYFLSAHRSLGLSFPDKNIFYISEEEFFANSVAFGAFVKSEKITAVFGSSDHLLWNCINRLPALKTLCKIGCYNTKWSKVPDNEFSSFDMNFPELWSKALNSFASSADKIQYVHPTLITR